MIQHVSRILLLYGFLFSFNACQQSVPPGAENDSKPGRTSPVGPTGDPSKPVTPAGNPDDGTQKKVVTKECCTFPLAQVPSDFCDTPGEEKAFGSNRKGWRKHGACDLLAPVGTPIYAVDDGVVSDFGYFYENTYFVSVKHPNFIIRYGEIKKSLASGITKGEKVIRGQLLGYIGKRIDDDGNPRKRSMLHFERFTGALTGNLSDEDSHPYQRRADLVDPTSDLRLWEKDLPK